MLSCISFDKICIRVCIFKMEKFRGLMSMGKIYYMMGKSASGKDTLYKEIRESCPELKTVTLYTTRPIRDGETDGVEYHFISKDTLDTYEKQGKVIESRTYHTIHGDWHYATLDDGQVELDRNSYIILGTLESFQKMKSYYGEENIIPVYIEVEDGERLKRALMRELSQEKPKYAEMCRRFLADSEDFSEENIQKAGITRRFINADKIQCLEEILGEIRYGKL